MWRSGIGPPNSSISFIAVGDKVRLIFGCQRPGKTVVRRAKSASFCKWKFCQDKARPLVAICRNLQILATRGLKFLMFLMSISILLGEKMQFIISRILVEKFCVL
jgi:hypothetical protein